MKLFRSFYYFLLRTKKALQVANLSGVIPARGRQAAGSDSKNTFKPFLTGFIYTCQVRVWQMLRATRVYRTLPLRCRFGRVRLVREEKYYDW